MWHLLWDSSENGETPDENYDKVQALSIIAALLTLPAVLLLFSVAYMLEPPPGIDPSEYDAPWGLVLLCSPLAFAAWVAGVAALPARGKGKVLAWIAIIISTPMAFPFLILAPLLLLL